MLLLLNLPSRHVPNQAWKANLSSVIAGGLLFPPELQRSDESNINIFRRMSLFSCLSKTYFPLMDLMDQRIILSQYCQLFGSNRTHFQIQLRVISDIDSVLGHLRSSLATHPHELSDILYSLLVVFVRKAEDIQSFVQKGNRASEVRPQVYRDDCSNARFNAFIRNEVYTPPSLAYDQYGMRFVYNDAGMELGDIVVYNNRSDIYELLLHLRFVICQIISFFKPQTAGMLSTAAGASSLLRSPAQQTHGVAPSPNTPMRVGISNVSNASNVPGVPGVSNVSNISNVPGVSAIPTVSNVPGVSTVPGVSPTMSAGGMNPSLGGANASMNPPANSSLSLNPGTTPTGGAEVPPLPFTERFVHLIYRFVIAYFNCGELYYEEVHRPREYVCVLWDCEG